MADRRSEPVDGLSETPGRGPLIDVLRVGCDIARRHEAGAGEGLVHLVMCDEVAGSFMTVLQCTCPPGRQVHLGAAARSGDLFVN